VIHAGSDRAWRLAQANLGGRLGEQVMAIERRSLALLAEARGLIDFPEQDLELASATAIRPLSSRHSSRRARRSSRGSATAARCREASRWRSSVRSTSVSRRCSTPWSAERALVGASPGTTGLVEVDDVWAGVAVTLLDTAGLRATDDPVEQRGIALGRPGPRCRCRVVVNDGIATGMTAGATAPSGRGPQQGRSWRRCSAGARAVGARDLGDDRARLDESIGAGSSRSRCRRPGSSEQAFVTTARQRALAGGPRCVRGGDRGPRSGRPPEVVAVELRDAAHALAQLRGVEVGDRVLDEVFARFCIGSSSAVPRPRVVAATRKGVTRPAGVAIAPSTSGAWQGV